MCVRYEMWMWGVRYGIWDMRYRILGVWCVVWCKMWDVRYGMWSVRCEE